MKRSKFDESRDDRISTEAGVERRLMCTANGCPNLWSTSIGNLCRWHADAEPRHWPELTQQLQWDETERARMRADPAPYVPPLTAGQKREIVAQMQLAMNRMRFAPADSTAWARAMRDREQRGEKLTEHLRNAWRNALGNPSNPDAEGTTP